MSATSATASLRPLRFLRHALDRVERVLRPTGADTVAADRRTDGPARTGSRPPGVDDDLDSTTTGELLVPTPGEPAAARASRQAQDYLERRRRKLNRDLGHGR